mgnify:FL=1
MNKHKNNPINHMLMMILCCALPILITAAIPFMGTLNTPLKTSLAAITPFLCPIMMVIMMFMMGNHNRGDCHGKKEEIDIKKLNNGNEVT